VSQVQAVEPDVETLAPPPDGEIRRVEGRTPWQLFWMRFKRDKIAMGAGIAVIVLVSFALLAPVIARFVVHAGPNERNDKVNYAISDIGIPLIGPGFAGWNNEGESRADVRHFFGVDTQGRDILVRTIYGARTSLTVAFLGTGFSLLFGIAFGLLAGFRGGKTDTFISRMIDIVLSLPLLLLAIGIAAACSASIEGCLGGFIQPGVRTVVFIIALFGWPYVARIVRGQTLSLREREFVEAARATGYGSAHIMFREILPNMLASIIVVMTLLIPQNILFESALSFLSVGIPPSTPSWGGMISDAVSGTLYKVAWWMLVFPGLFLLITTLAFNLLGDGLRDALDPRTGR
jgi:ABC-type dipeptide/oligopeptide/nickel transport system permease subunit